MQTYHDRLRSTLIKARDKVAHAWTTHAAARDEDGRQVEAMDMEACSWCATGAVEASAMGMDYHCVVNDVTSMLAAEIPPGEAVGPDMGWTDFCKVQGFNDNAGGNGPVVALFDKALARLDREARRI